MNERDATDRREELLADQTLFGLTIDEQEELERLSAHKTQDDSLERTAAIVAMALHSQSDSPLPDGLKQTILDSFKGRTLNSLVDLPRTSAPESDFADETDQRLRTPVRMNRREVVAWMVAAASLAGVIVDRNRLLTFSNRERSAADSRTDLIHSQSDIVSVPWVSTNDPSARGVKGDVIWSTHAQQGALRITGLAPNEPIVHQYQLWIFDKGRDDRYPINGGTFNIETKNQETVISVRPQLRVVQPTMFAVSIEKTGGVVVSTRERLLLIATVPESSPV